MESRKGKRKNKGIRPEGLMERGGMRGITEGRREEKGKKEELMKDGWKK